MFHTLAVSREEKPIFYSHYGGLMRRWHEDYEITRRVVAPGE